MCELVNFPQTHGAVGSNSKTPNFESAGRAFHPPGLIIAIVMELDERFRRALVPGPASLNKRTYYRNWYDRRISSDLAELSRKAIIVKGKQWRVRKIANHILNDSSAMTERSIKGKAILWKKPPGQLFSCIALDRRTTGSRQTVGVNLCSRHGAERIMV
ncbi:hypothetical protein RRG08_040595 [Elysia crispata]|uniref:Uncharacterized protein n=1 Tax=Elysia crispata TaxID=231223 RepID=A0AAE0YKQ0_9GAST|nr:hypothetical protein RRG08_040595 [Elysia crispata]